MSSDFQAQYEQLDDEQLLEVAADRESLTEDARTVLDAELQGRGLAARDFKLHEEFVRRGTQREALIRRRKLLGTRESRKETYLQALILVATAAIFAIWFMLRRHFAHR